MATGMPEKTDIKPPPTKEALRRHDRAQSLKHDEHMVSQRIDSESGPVSKPSLQQSCATAVSANSLRKLQQDSPGRPKAGRSTPGVQFTGESRLRHGRQAHLHPESSMSRVPLLAEDDHPVRAAHAKPQFKASNIPLTLNSTFFGGSSYFYTALHDNSLQK